MKDNEGMQTVFEKKRKTKKIQGRIFPRFLAAAISDRGGTWEAFCNDDRCKMAEAKVKNLLRLSRPRNKFDAVILAVHSCLAERGFRCINSGEEVRYLRCSQNGMHLGTLILRP